MGEHISMCLSRRTHTHTHTHISYLETTDTHTLYSQTTKWSKHTKTQAHRDYQTQRTSQLADKRKPQLRHKHRAGWEHAVERSRHTHTRHQICHICPDRPTHEQIINEQAHTNARSHKQTLAHSHRLVRKRLSNIQMHTPIHSYKCALTHTQTNSEN